MADDYLTAFPGLVPSHCRTTSPQAPSYNCIAWAAGDVDRWWWPDVFLLSFWPDGVARAESIETFVAAFATLGYVESSTDQLEQGFEKVAIYAVGETPKHAARQLPSGRWTSKLGQGEDIEHTLAGLEGELYGRVVKILKRPR